MSELPNIILVHGAWADGSCWSDVIKALQSDGYQVTAPQFPGTSLAADVARLRQVLAGRTARRFLWAIPTAGRSSRRSALMNRRSPGSCTSPRSRSSRESRWARSSARDHRNPRWPT